MNQTRIEFRQPAEIALRALPTKESAPILRAIEHLAEDPTRPHPAVKIVDKADGLRSLRVAESLRVLFKVKPDGTLVVLDVVNREMVERYFHLAI